MKYIIILTIILELEEVIDGGFWIRSQLEPLSLKLFRNEYIHIVKMVIHNFTQNDMKDGWFNHAQDVQDLFPPGNKKIFAIHQKHIFSFS